MRPSDSMSSAVPGMVVCPSGAAGDDTSPSTPTGQPSAALGVIWCPGAQTSPIFSLSLSMRYLVSGFRDQRDGVTLPAELSSPRLCYRPRHVSAARGSPLTPCYRKPLDRATLTLHQRPGPPSARASVDLYFVLCYEFQFVSCQGIHSTSDIGQPAPGD